MSHTVKEKEELHLAENTLVSTLKRGIPRKYKMTQNNRHSLLSGRMAVGDCFTYSKHYTWENIRDLCHASGYCVVHDNKTGVVDIRGYGFSNMKPFLDRKHRIRYVKDTINKQVKRVIQQHANEDHDDTHVIFQYTDNTFIVLDIGWESYDKYSFIGTEKSLNLETYYDMGLVEGNLYSRMFAVREIDSKLTRKFVQLHHVKEVLDKYPEDVKKLVETGEIPR